ncbi:hypothetical protein WJX72_003141 [[Myrmecia] bisecta]|uniref:Uncharacterized protein n=1 Tax=[Myrmecia] bisecta TaxID=41462 RepID=A0AAW1PJX9_9CHLO
MGQTASSEQERSDVRDVLKRRLGADAAAEFNDCDLDKLVRGGFHNDVTVAGAKYQAVRDVGLKPALCSLILTGGQEAVERKHAKPDGAREGFPINTKAPLYSHLLARTLNMTAPYEQYMFWVSV